MATDSVMIDVGDLKGLNKHGCPLTRWNLLRSSIRAFVPDVMERLNFLVEVNVGTKCR